MLKKAKRSQRKSRRNRITSAGGTMGCLNCDSSDFVISLIGGRVIGWVTVVGIAERGYPVGSYGIVRIGIGGIIGFSGLAWLRRGWFVSGDGGRGGC